MKHTQQIINAPLTNLSVLKTEANKMQKKRKIFKRISPFVLLTCFLIFVFTPYVLFFYPDHYSYVKLILIPGIAVYVMFADFALWNYFEGKRKIMIWMIESVVTSVIILLML